MQMHGRQVLAFMGVIVYNWIPVARPEALLQELATAFDLFTWVLPPEL
jgi:hypothetical protein